MKDDKLYLLHISECISRIESYIGAGQDAFMASTLIQDAVIRNLQIIGESARRISDDLKSSHPAVDWRGVAGFRNVLVHDYLDLDMVLIWQVLARDLPALKSETVAILQSLR